MLQLLLEWHMVVSRPSIVAYQPGVGLECMRAESSRRMRRPPDLSHLVNFTAQW